MVVRDWRPALNYVLVEFLVTCAEMFTVSPLCGMFWEMHGNIYFMLSKKS